MWSAIFQTLNFPSLAEIQVTAEQVQLLIYAIIAAVIVGGLGSIKAVTDIIRFFRGDPPSDQRFASKGELSAAHDELRAVEQRGLAGLAEIKKAHLEIFVELRAINRSLGRIEGHQKD